MANSSSDAFSLDDFSDDFENDGINHNEAATVHEALAAILISGENDATLPANVIYRLSELDGADLAVIEEAWYTISAPQRRWLMRILTEAGEADFTISFDPLANLGLNDTDAGVRAEAIELTWHDFSEPTFHRLMNLVKDESPVVRAAAMAGLGRFIQAGEFEEFDMKLAKTAQQVALRAYQNYGEDLEVRRRALESVSHSSHPSVTEMIREAYYADDVLMQTSAVFAMGSSFDDQWKDIVLAELESDIPEIQFEAVRAAGQLELLESVPVLADLVRDEDYEIQLMAVWSLGEIATQEAQRILTMLAEDLEDSNEDELLIAIEEALETAYLLNTGSLPMYALDGDMDFDDDDDFEDDDYLDESDGIYLN